MPWPKGKPRPQYLKDRTALQMKGNTHAKGHAHTEEHKQKIAAAMKGKKNALGSKCSEERKDQVRQQMLGNKYLLGHQHSEESRAKMSAAHMGNQRRLGIRHSDETLMRMSQVKLGDNNSAYIDGKGYERQKARRIEAEYVGYRIWRRNVFERDNHTCQLCGQRGGVLTADHIKPWCNYPDLRYELTNGRTLCVPCHRKTDTYGIKARGK